MNKILLYIIIASIPMVNSCSAKEQSYTFSYNKIKLTFVVSEFDKNKSTITDCGEGYICQIDNSPFWGSDGGIPQSALSKAFVTVNGKNIKLETSGMYNPSISNSTKNNYVVKHYYGNTWKVRGTFSDGAGAYHAEWLITKDGSMRILLGDGELLYDAFNSIFKKN